MPSCPECNTSFDSLSKLRWHHKSKHGKSLPNCQCANCGEPYYSEHKRKYCSAECQYESLNFEGENNPNYRGGKKSTNCIICGTEFNYYPSEKKGLYCAECVKSQQWQDPPNQFGSESTLWKGGKETRECAIGGSSVTRFPSGFTSDTVVCSESCRREWLSESFTGEGHPNWTGGEELRYGPRWSKVREQALKRDGHQCVRCEVTRQELGQNPDVHHIIPVRYFAESDIYRVRDAHTMDNVVTLCVSCHRKAEHGHVDPDSLRVSIGATPSTAWM